MNEELNELEALEGIRSLRCENARLFNEWTAGSDVERELIKQYSENCQLVTDQFGTYSGRAEISEFLRVYRNNISAGLHFILGHVIDVSPAGNEASGTWLAWNPIVHNGLSMIISGNYADGYVRNGDKWQFSKIDFKSKFISVWGEGWAENRVSPAWKWQK